MYRTERRRSTCCDAQHRGDPAAAGVLVVFKTLLRVGQTISITARERAFQSVLLYMYLFCILT